MQAKLRVERDFTVGTTDPWLFGSFIEHLGRAVYGGIYEPGHPQAGADGFRRDTAALIRELGITTVRYPGGNFVSGYNWEDGVGPQALRPRRPDLAWRSVETNQFGVDEFADWCRFVGAEPMMAVNLGTRGVAEAIALLEYCNLPGGTAYSDLRRTNGHADPHGIRLWCLGNEVDGPWQVGHKTARAYGQLARETAHAMKMLDPDVQLIAAGSSNSGMATFMDWEREVLEEAWEDVDFLSLHQYIGNADGDYADFLAKPLETERFLNAVIAACDFVQAKKRSRKTMYLSFDEYNVWYHSHKDSNRIMREEPWREAPPILEDVYNFADTLALGGMLLVFLRHCDRLKMACLAQLVNVIAPIMTETGGRAWRQTIFYPLLHVSQYGRGTVLQTKIESPKYDSHHFTDVPCLDACVVDTGETLTVFALNRNTADPLTLEAKLGGYSGLRVCEHLVLHHDDPEAVNTADAQPVAPVRADLAAADGDTLTAQLPAASWNVIRLKKAE